MKETCMKLGGTFNTCSSVQNHDFYIQALKPLRRQLGFTNDTFHYLESIILVWMILWSTTVYWIGLNGNLCKNK